MARCPSRAPVHLRAHAAYDGGMEKQATDLTAAPACPIAVPEAASDRKPVGLKARWTGGRRTRGRGAKIRYQNPRRPPVFRHPEQADSRAGTRHVAAAAL